MGSQRRALDGLDQVDIGPGRTKKLGDLVERGDVGIYVRSGMLDGHGPLFVRPVAIGPMPRFIIAVQ